MTHLRIRSTTLAAVVLAATTPVAVWGLLGQDDAPGFSPGQLDYMTRPWDIPPLVEHALTICSVVLLAVTGARLASAAVRGRLDMRWLAVLGPLLVAGASAALLQRSMTAGGIGANIGGAIAEFVLVPFIGGLLVFAAAFSLYLWNTP